MVLASSSVGPVIRVHQHDAIFYEFKTPFLTTSVVVVVLVYFTVMLASSYFSKEPFFRLASGCCIKGIPMVNEVCL